MFIISKKPLRVSPTEKNAEGVVLVFESSKIFFKVVYSWSF